MMPNLLEFEPIRILGFLVILARISGLIISAPVLGDDTIPLPVKGAFAFILSLLFFPLVAAPSLGPNPGLLSLTLTMLREVAVGLVLGFTARVVFVGIQLAGEVIGFQMGIGVANVFDPSSDEQIPLLGQMQSVLAMFLFVVADGHHLLIRAVAESYTLVPPGAMQLTQPGYHYAVLLFSTIFVIGIQVGAPLIVAMLAANFSIGLIARSVPQVNVFVVGFPFTILLGILFLAVSFPFFAQAVMTVNEQLAEMLMQALRVLR
ncbi:MAG: flagellar biosynthetic protein FliR [Candidatus Lambdaproteobacteria bacterium]|nr:flagellar biosynthetic protein FliR [Candidatus Lambdaproteobacteria bacterium]